MVNVRQTYSQHNIITADEGTAAATIEEVKEKPRKKTYIIDGFLSLLFNKPIIQLNKIETKIYRLDTLPHFHAFIFSIFFSLSVLSSATSPQIHSVLQAVISRLLNTKYHKNMQNFESAEQGFVFFMSKH